MVKVFSFEDLKLVATGPVYIKPVNIEGRPTIITGKYVFIKRNAHTRRKIDLLLMENEPESLKPLPIFISTDWCSDANLDKIFEINFVIVNGEYRVLDINEMPE
jgi:hypothetical protein